MNRRGVDSVAEGFEFVADVEVEMPVEVFWWYAVFCTVADDGFDGPAVDGVG